MTPVRAFSFGTTALQFNAFLRVGALDIRAENGEKCAPCRVFSIFLSVKSVNGASCCIFLYKTEIAEKNKERKDIGE